MNFKYRKLFLNSKSNSFPGQKIKLRPIIPIRFNTPSGEFEYFVVIDSGSDCCLFSNSVGEKLGLDIKSGKEATFYGTSGIPQKAYFHKVSFKIGAKLHTCYVGFSYDIDDLAYGLLGQYGFFNKWIVKFDYKKENIELKEIKK